MQQIRFNTAPRASLVAGVQQRYPRYRVARRAAPRALSYATRQIDILALLISSSPFASAAERICRIADGNPDAHIAAHAPAVS